MVYGEDNMFYMMVLYWEIFLISSIVLLGSYLGDSIFYK